MRRRALLEDKNSGNDGVFELPDGSHASPMSVVFANKKAKRLEITDNWSLESHPKEIFEPIGIVVIPAEHGVLKDGTGTVNQCGVMSLVPMSCDTPEKGGTIKRSIYWGYNALNISSKADELGRKDSVTNGLTNYTKVNIVGNNGIINETVQGTYDSAYLPCDLIGENLVIENPYDNGTRYWYDNSYYAPSPYKNDGSYNTIYGQTKSPAASTNALSDFKGIVNTKILTDLATAQSNWKTDSSIVNSYESGYYPAACCCARFKTTGTKSFVNCTTEELRNGTGFWYLPAMGELGYIYVRVGNIFMTMGTLISNYGIGVNIEANNYYWSSTECDKSKARHLRMMDGCVVNGDKDHSTYNETNYVLAFMRL